MSEKALQEKIENYWEKREDLNPTDVSLCTDVDEVLNLLDIGKIRVSEKKRRLMES